MRAPALAKTRNKLDHADLESPPAPKCTAALQKNNVRRADRFVFPDGTGQGKVLSESSVCELLRCIALTAHGVQFFQLSASGPLDLLKTTTERLKAQTTDWRSGPFSNFSRLSLKKNESVYNVEDSLE